MDRLQHHKDFEVHTSTIAKDIILISNLFEYFDVAYILRNRNIGSFRLAKLTTEGASVSVWDSEFPPWLMTQARMAY